MKKILALLAALLPTPAFAGSNTLAVTPGSGVTFQTTTNASGNNLGQSTIWDYLNAANGWSIDTNHGGLVAGEGTAGTPAGGVVSVQGVASGTALPVSGSVSITGTPTVSGTVAATQSGSWAMSITGTPAVTLSGTAAVGVNQWAGTTLGAPSNYGTPPTGIVPGVNAYVTNQNANGAATVGNSAPVTPSNPPVGAGNLATSQTSVITTATLLANARTGVSGTGRVSITVCNTGSSAVFLGGSAVSTTTGQYLAGVPGACATFNYTGALYGIVASGTDTVAVSETY